MPYICDKDKWYIYMPSYIYYRNMIKVQKQNYKMKLFGFFLFTRLYIIYIIKQDDIFFSFSILFWIPIFVAVFFILIKCWINKTVGKAIINWKSLITPYWSISHSHSNHTKTRNYKGIRKDILTNDIQHGGTNISKSLVIWNEDL